MTVYEGQYAQLEVMPPGIAEWGYQDEVCPETGRKHRQGYVRTRQQVRFSAMQKMLPGIHIEIAKNWDALREYCKKVDTAVPGTQVHQVQSIPTHFSYADEVAKYFGSLPQTPPVYRERLIEYDYIQEHPDGKKAKTEIRTQRVNELQPTYILDMDTDNALKTIDDKVRMDIMAGRPGIEWIASNPAWIAMWKKYWREKIYAQVPKTDRQTDTGEESPVEV